MKEKKTGTEENIRSRKETAISDFPFGSTCSLLVSHSCKVKDCLHAARLLISSVSVCCYSAMSVIMFSIGWTWRGNKAGDLNRCTGLNILDKDASIQTTWMMLMVRGIPGEVSTQVSLSQKSFIWAVNQIIHSVWFPPDSSQICGG